MINAAIDIGTNTVLLLVGNAGNGNLEILYEEQKTPRLGKGVDKSRRLSKQAMQSVIDALKAYKEVLSDRFSEVDSIYVTATSAVRDASNRQEFIERVYEETGLRVEVLSGIEEARLTFLGAKSVLNITDKQSNAIIDIGGGSTEIALGTGQKIIDRYSFDIGCVRFTERFFKNDDHPVNTQIESCKNAILDALNKHRFNFTDETNLIGVAGTVTSLAFIEQGLISYDRKKLNGYAITIDMIKNHIEETSKGSPEQLLRRYPVVMEGRADIFLAGLIILEAFMQKYDFSEIITSTGGIRHGVLVDRYK